MTRKRARALRRRLAPTCTACGDCGVATEATGRLRRCTCKALRDSRGEAALARQARDDARLEELGREPSIRLPPTGVPDDAAPQSSESQGPGRREGNASTGLPLPHDPWQREWWALGLSDDGWDRYDGPTWEGECEPMESLSREGRYHTRIARTQALQAAALYFVSQLVSDQRQRKVALQYSRKLGECGRTLPQPRQIDGKLVWSAIRKEMLWLRCPSRHSRFVIPCCQCPVCPRQQRRRSARWRARIESGPPLPRTGAYRWRHVEFSMRQQGLASDADIVEAIRAGDRERLQRLASSVAACVDAGLDLRARFMRMLRDKYGDPATWIGFAKIEMGADGMVHIHALVYCRWLPRATKDRSSPLQRWLRAQDCSVPGCQHPADDRCDACRQGGRECGHPECLPGGGLRTRCGGSWYVHVNEPYEKRPDGSRVRGTRNAIHELAKYITKPLDAPKRHRKRDGASIESEEAVVLSEMDDTAFLIRLAHALRGDGPFAELYARALREMVFHVALRGRHCVESYGLARVKSDDATMGDDVEPGPDAETRPCEHCAAEGRPGVAMRCIARGERARSGLSIAWRFRQDLPERGPP